MFWVHHFYESMWLCQRDDFSVSLFLFFFFLLFIIILHINIAIIILENYKIVVIVVKEEKKKKHLFFVFFVTAIKHFILTVIWAHSVSETTQEKEREREQNKFLKKHNLFEKKFFFIYRSSYSIGVVYVSISNTALIFCFC